MRIQEYKLSEIDGEAVCLSKYDSDKPIVLTKREFAMFLDLVYKSSFKIDAPPEDQNCI